MIDRIVEELSNPRHIAVAIKSPEDGGLPRSPGLYAWWVLSTQALPTAPLEPRPEDALSVLYVGIAPSGPRSSQTLRSRVGGNHIRGNVGASTFRLSLAALLWQEETWLPLWSGSRPTLSRADNDALSAWQRENLRVAWSATEEPWRYENEVFKRMSPPLNLAGNAQSEFRATLTAARSALRAASRAG